MKEHAHDELEKNSVMTKETSLETVKSMIKSALLDSITMSPFKG
jgi:hypothetical protein